MYSTDEDLELFLEELGQLLNKYHYDLSPFTLRKINDTSIMLGAFNANGIDGTFSPKYYQKIDENKDEDET